MSFVATLNLKQLQEALDPWTHRRRRCHERWHHCRVAAAAALKACADLSVYAACTLRRRDLDLGPANGAVASFLHPIKGQRMPLLAAARSMLKLYLDAMPFKNSEFVFVDDDGGVIDPDKIRRQMLAGGRSIGIPDLHASLKATFFHAVDRSTAGRDVKAALLRRETKEWPDLERLLAGLAEHPLAPYGRIAFYDRKTPDDPFFREIFSLTEMRTVPAEEQAFVRNRFFPDAFRLYEADLLTATQLGRFFGVGRHEAGMWVRRYRDFGYLARTGEDQSPISQQWRTVVMTEYERLLTEDGPSLAELHRHLVANCKFPYGYDAVIALFARIGERVPKPVGTMTAQWRGLVDREYEACRGRPGTWMALFESIRHEHAFPYCFKTMLTYVKERGFRPPDDVRGHWMKVAVEAAARRRPTGLEEFHRDLVDETDFPMTAATLASYLEAAGISLMDNARNRKQELVALLAREAHLRRPTDRAEFHRQMVEEFNFPFGESAAYRYLKQSGIFVSDFRRAGGGETSSGSTAGTSPKGFVVDLVQQFESRCSDEDMPASTGKTSHLASSGARG